MKIQQFCLKQFQEGMLLEKSRPHWGVTHSVDSSLWARFHLMLHSCQQSLFLWFLEFLFHLLTCFSQCPTKRMEGLRWSFTLWQLEQVPCTMQRRMWADKSRMKQSEPWIRHDGPWWPMMTHDDPWWPMMTHDDPWWPMMTHDDPWWPMMTHDDPWWPMMTHDDPWWPWWPMMTHDDPWWPMMTHDDPWWPMITHDDPWWPMMTHDDPWWLMMTPTKVNMWSRWSPIQIWTKHGKGQRNVAKCQDGLSLNVSCA